MARPNIVVVTAGGLRWDSFGCTGNPDARTPNIDALAAHGVRFSQAMSPYPQHRAGAHAFLNAATPPRFVPGQLDVVAPVTALTLPLALRGADYTTGAIGTVDFPSPEVAAACDQVMATGCAGLPDAYLDWLHQSGQSLHDVSGAQGGAGSDPVPFRLAEPYHPTVWAGNQAVRYCQTAREPFFLWVNFPAPRWPADTPVAWKNMYRPSRLTLPAGFTDGGADSGAGVGAPRLRRILAAYYGAISHLDRQLGRILATLTARGRTNNVIVVTACRGDYLGDHGLTGRGAGPLYDPLLRVPLVIGGHSGQRKGAVDPALVSLSDVVPTLLELAQLGHVEPPDGASLVPLLSNAGAPRRKVVLFRDSEGAPGMRTARYRWLAPDDADREGLFDLQADPLEMHNLRDRRQSPALRKMLEALA